LPDVIHTAKGLAMSRLAPREFARKLRRNGTDAERALWFHLRDRRLGGLKFRRQHPIGPYTVDFACVEARLIVELDGGQHLDACSRDALRTAFLEAQGWRVIRLWDHEALALRFESLEAVLAAACPTSPAPAPG
jgi:adenine-specific DNA-methyltransferase